MQFSRKKIWYPRLLDPQVPGRLNPKSLSHSIVSLKYLILPRVWLSRADCQLWRISIPKSVHLKFFIDDSLLDVCPLMTGGKWMYNFPLLKLFNSHPLPQLCSSVILSNSKYSSHKPSSFIFSLLLPHVQPVTKFCWCYRSCMSWTGPGTLQLNQLHPYSARPTWLSIVLKRQQKVFNCSSLSSMVRFLLRSWIPWFTIVPFLPSFLLQRLYQMLLKPYFGFLSCCQSCTGRSWSEWLSRNDRLNPGGNEGECSWWNSSRKPFPCHYGMRCHGILPGPYSCSWRN